MRKAVAGLLLLVAFSAHAVSYYKPPALKVSYTDAAGTTYGVVDTIVMPGIEIVAQASVVTVHILNNYGATRLITAEAVDYTGNATPVWTAVGCDAVLNVGQSCDVLLTNTPESVGLDQYQHYLRVYGNGILLKTINLQSTAE